MAIFHQLHPSLRKMRKAARQEGTPVLYLRASLCAVAAVLLGIFGPAVFVSLWHGAKATGFGVFRAFLPMSAILAVVFFTVFFAASRLHSKALRLLLFWTPVTLILILGVGLLTLVVNAWLHVPRG